MGPPRLPTTAQTQHTFRTPRHRCRGSYSTTQVLLGSIPPARACTAHALTFRTVVQLAVLYSGVRHFGRCSILAREQWYTFCKRQKLHHHAGPGRGLLPQTPATRARAGTVRRFGARTIVCGRRSLVLGATAAAAPSSSSSSSSSCSHFASVFVRGYAMLSGRLEIMCATHWRTGCVVCDDLPSGCAPRFPLPRNRTNPLQHRNTHTNTHCEILCDGRWLRWMENTTRAGSILRWESESDDRENRRRVNQQPRRSALY